MPKAFRWNCVFLMVQKIDKYERNIIVYISDDNVSQSRVKNYTGE